MIEITDTKITGNLLKMLDNRGLQYQMLHNPDQPHMVLRIFTRKGK